MIVVIGFVIVPTLWSWSFFQGASHAISLALIEFARPGLGIVLGSSCHCLVIVLSLSLSCLTLTLTLTLTLMCVCARLKGYGLRFRMKVKLKRGRGWGLRARECLSCACSLWFSVLVMCCFVLSLFVFCLLVLYSGVAASILRIQLIPVLYVGDVIFTESPTWFQMRHMFLSHGLTIVPVER